jgi:hypothetical protein
LKFEGQESIRVNDAGELVIKTSLGEVTNGKLYSYQTDNGIKTEVTCKFVQSEDGTISLKAIGYDRSKELIIDPLIYSTFLGGSGEDCGYSMEIDRYGNSYIAGTTSSLNYPTTSGAYDTTYGGRYSDVFVTKLNSTGSELIYSTFIGGNDDDRAYALTLDVAGNVYLTGNTYSLNYPITPLIKIVWV